MNKKALSEADIKAKFITPAIINAGWDELTQIGREIYFTTVRFFGERSTACAKSECWAKGPPLKSCFWLPLPSTSGNT